jgi:hypothetical protein
MANMIQTVNTLAQLQLQQVQQNAGMGPRGQRKLAPFSSADGADWVTWRRSFELTVQINTWHDERARQELAAAMEGAAASATATLRPPLFPTVGVMLAAYQMRFLPEVESDLARVSFRGAVQFSDEAVLAWHSRLRDLFYRAWPTLPEDSKLLIDQFVIGLARSSVKKYTWEHRPATYSLALEYAQNATASAQILSSTAMGSAAVGHKRGLHAIGSAPGEREGAEAPSIDAIRKCYQCGSTKHLKRNCTSRGGRSSAPSSGQRRPPPPRRRAGTSGRGRGRTGRRGQGRRFNAAMGAPEDGDYEDDLRCDQEN